MQITYCILKNCFTCGALLSHATAFSGGNLILFVLLSILCSWQCVQKSFKIHWGIFTMHLMQIFQHKRLNSKLRARTYSERFISFTLSMDTVKNDARRSPATLLSGCGMWIYSRFQTRQPSSYIIFYIPLIHLLHTESD